ncbi:MAG: hypothetical protein AAGK78_05400, partial [Planctomycetota bacterium]
PNFFGPEVETGNYPDYFDRNVAAGDNTDSISGEGNFGNLSFRHGNQGNANFRGTSTNILYADGHAENQKAAGTLEDFDGVLDTGLSRRATLFNNQ